MVSLITGSMIREQDPLKQGLKQSIDCPIARELRIREQDPLKQGLKLGTYRLIGLQKIIFVSKIH